MHTDLLTYIKADTDLYALVGDRVHWQLAPQGQTMPFVVLTRVSDSAGHEYSGGIYFRNMRLQVDCYAETMGGAVTILRAVQDLISGTRFIQGSTSFEGGFVLDSRDFTEDNQSSGTRIHRQSQDYNIFYKEV